MNEMNTNTKRIAFKRKVDRLTYSEVDAAKALGVDVNKLRVLVEMGEIKQLKLGAKKIPKDEIRRFIHEGAESGTDYNKLIQDYLNSKKEMQEA